MPVPSIVAFPGRLTITDAAGVPCPGAKFHIAIGVRISATDGAYTINTLGWNYRRGRDA